MQRTAFAVLWASAVAAPLVVAIPIIVGAQSAAPQPAPAQSAWFAQHQAFAQIRMDEAALAMGRSAEQIAKNEAVKKLAADVVRRSHEGSRRGPRRVRQTIRQC
jgi:hypothetical protein